MNATDPTGLYSWSSLTEWWIPAYDDGTTGAKQFVGFSTDLHNCDGGLGGGGGRGGALDGGAARFGDGSTSGGVATGRVDGGGGDEREEGEEEETEEGEEDGLWICFPDGGGPGIPHCETIDRDAFCNNLEEFGETLPDVRLTTASGSTTLLFFRRA